MDATGTTSDGEDMTDRLRQAGGPAAVSDAAAGPPAEDQPHPPPRSRAPEAPLPVADDPVRQAAEAFADELIRLRTAAGLSQSALARRLGYDKSYVTHLERCTQAPTQPVARQADHFLGSGGALSRLWHAYHTARAAGRRQPPQDARSTVDALEGPGPEAAARDPHDAGEHPSAVPETGSGGQPGALPVFDLRGAKVNVQYGDHNTQHITC
ncbi:helix-turn-helix domain-containing protein [Streptomyces niger]|uniref:helix-turn-helix domain-containing protein n=1 Tax=Streptomyces niger TaxID=66373 RepID=UPI00069C11F7|nr:helix-turn-helix transcriptional regulator [Streptomyces niger]